MDDNASPQSFPMPRFSVASSAVGANDSDFVSPAVLIDEIADPTFVVDLAERVRLANTAAMRALGAQSSGELIGRALDDVRPHDGGRCKSCPAPVGAARPLDWLTGHCEDRHNQRWRTVKRPLLADDGGRIGMLYRFVDITDECAASRRERRARADVQLLRQILDAVPDLIYAKDADLRFTFANAATCQVMGTTLEEVIGKTDLEFFPPDIAQSFVEDERRALARGEESHYTQEMRLPDGSRGTLYSLKVPVRGRSDQSIGLVGHGRDVTALLRAETALARSARELDEAQRVAGLANWRWVVGAPTMTCSVNMANVAGLDAPVTEIAVRDVLRRLCHHCRQALLSAVRTALANGAQRALEVAIGGHERTNARMRLSFHREVEAGELSLFGICQNITEQKRIEQRLNDLAFHDGLTGLANRAALNRSLIDAVERHDASGEPAALLLVDLDRFKAINDTLGHAAGDTLLRLVAERLQATVRKADVVARLGGDEFAVVVPAADRRSVVLAIAKRIVEALRTPFELDGTSVTIGASIGVARLPEHAKDADTWLNYADLALYKMKGEGRDGVRVFERSLDRNQRLRLDLIAELREAIGHGRLDVHYQPQVDVRDGRIVGFEALARWNHPARGLISPAEFVALAEQSSLIGDLGRYVLSHACAQWRRFADAGRTDVSVSVNVSPAQLWHMDLVAEVRRTLRAYAMPADRLVLEVTENVFLDHHRSTVTAMLRDLGAMGTKLSLDDFGTGYSSLSYLSSLPFHHLKIDRCFVDGADQDVERTRLLEGIVALGHALRLEVVAEGIETPGEVAMLQRLDCDFGQGFHFGRPVDPAAALQALGPFGPEA